MEQIQDYPPPHTHFHGEVGHWWYIHSLSSIEVVHIVIGKVRHVAIILNNLVIASNLCV